VAARKRALLLRGLVLVHLRRDLAAAQVAWENGPSHLRESDFVAKRDASQDSTSYGIASDIQRKLSAIWTNLDSFNDVEAHALMTSPYRMTNAAALILLPGSTPDRPGLAILAWQDVRRPPPE